MTSDLGQHMRAVARELLGDPNPALSNDREWRYGTRGSFCVDLGKGVWSNHSESEGTPEAGGGVLALIKLKTGRDGAAAFEWLREHGIQGGDEQHKRLNGSNGVHHFAAGELQNVRVAPKVVGTYDYTDEGGDLLFQVQRFEPKTFKQRRVMPDGSWGSSIRAGIYRKGSSGWFRLKGNEPAHDGDLNLPDVRQVPYRLPEIQEAIATGSLVLVVEGEKDVDRLTALGVPATTNAAGSGKWPEALNEHFAGADVVIVPDNDEAGRKHRDQVAVALAPVANRVRVLEILGLPEKGDVSDWIAAGGTAEALYDLIVAKAATWGVQPFQSKFRAAFVHDLVGSPPNREWLVKGAILARTFALMLGEPGCGKSFLALDLAMSSALAAVDERAPDRWFGRVIKPCGVIYIAAEGQEDFVLRMQAWLMAKSLPMSTRMPCVLMPTAIDLCTGAQTQPLVGEVDALRAIIRDEFTVDVGLVVVDTVNRSLGGGNENNSDVMGGFIKSCDALRIECRAAVLGVHHVTGGTKARGHGSLHGGNDAEILVVGAAEGAPNRWTIVRQKAGPVGGRHEFRLRQKEMAIDAEGDPVTSCVVTPLASEPSMQEAEMRDAASAQDTRKAHMTADGRAILGDNLTVVLRCLDEAIKRTGKIPPIEVRGPHGRQAATTKEWLDEIVRAMPGDDKADPKFRDKCRKARDAAAPKLRNRGIIGMDEEWAWRTDRRVAMIDSSDATARNSSSDHQPSETERSISDAIVF